VTNSPQLGDSYLAHTNRSIQKTVDQRVPGDNDRVAYCMPQRRDRDDQRPVEIRDTRSTNQAIILGNQSRGSMDICESNSREYNYQLIDTLVINRSPTPDQISTMSVITPDRPIDSIHSINFQ
jgi:hypothetical protein